jgi:hypothetical protein
LANLFSKIAESPILGYFAAHCFFAYFLMHVIPKIPHVDVTQHQLVVQLVILAAFKEFYIDLKYEQKPPQTFVDSLQDFVGYIAGITIGVFL